MPLPQIDPGQPFTFAVLGDHRGGSDGNVPPVLLDIFDRINADAPAFAVSTGDIINGYPEEDEPHIRKLWNGYRAALQRLKPPMIHVPGNHDIFNEASQRLWRELWGPARFAFDFGGTRFIALDSETVPHRIDPAQLAWLREQLESAGEQRVFVFVHQPVFPVDGHIGTSLDKFPDARDQLHALLVAHKAKIHAVFVGHEHLFHFERHDGIAYYTTAGAGAPLYVPQALGGFYHYLLVRVAGATCEVEVRKVWTPEIARPPARVVAPGELLESWEHPVLWTVWDQTVSHGLIDAPVTDGSKALKLSFNLAHYEWPTLSTTFSPPRDLRDVERVKVDIFVPDETPDGLVVKGGFEGPATNESQPIALKNGWNTIALNLNDAWLNPTVRRQARLFQLAFGGNKRDAVYSIVVDNVRAERESGAAALFESWEQPLTWHTWDEATASGDTANPAHGSSALKLSLDFSDRKRPTLYSALAVPWNLSDVNRLAVSVTMPPVTSAVSVTLALTGEMETCRSPAVPLKPGRHDIEFELDWAPVRIRRDVREVRWIFQPTGDATTTSITIDNLRALTD